MASSRSCRIYSWVRAKGWFAFAVNGCLAAVLPAQENRPQLQQWVTQKSTDGAYAASAHAMVEKQLRPRGIDDSRVLRAMAKVQRENFVANELAGHAYEDRPLPIGFGQTISQPFIVAFMTQELKPKPTDRVLEIGTGSGYQAAVLAELVAQVYTIEIVRPLAERAAVVLSGLGYKNVLVKGGDGYKGWPEHAPFDAIIVTAAPDHVPQPLVEQLKEGGRMVIPVGKTYAQELKVLEKHGGVVKQTAVIPVKFVPLTRDPEKK